MASISAQEWANIGAQVFGGLAKATPAVVSILQKPKEAVLDAAAISAQFQEQAALKAQAAVVAQQAQARAAQAQAEVEVQRLRSSTASRLLIYGGIAILVAVGIMYLAGRGRGKDA